MVNLRQSISTFKKKGTDVITASPTTKFRKMPASSPGNTGSSAHKRMTMFNLRSKEKKDDLSSHIGEIKVTTASTELTTSDSHKRFGSLQGFTVEEEVTEEDDLARKTDLKLQERRELRRRRQTALQMQLQQKLHHAPDLNNTSPNKDNNFPSALPLDSHNTESGEFQDTPRISGGRKSTLIRNRRTGDSDRPIRASVIGQSQPGEPSTPTQRGRSPGKRMPRKSRILEGMDQQRTAIRPLPVHKETSAEQEKSETIQEKDEEERRTTREQMRKARKRGDEGANNGETSVEFDASKSPYGDRRSLTTEKQAGQQSASRRERRKTEFGMGQRKSSSRSTERGGDASQLSPGTSKSSGRSSGTAKKKAEIRGRHRQSVRAIKDLPEILGDLEATHGRTAGLDASHRSVGRTAGLDTSHRSVGRTAGLDNSIRNSDRIDDSQQLPAGRKSKLSRDEGDDQGGLGNHSDHRMSISARRKRREKMEIQENNPLHQSEHGKGTAVKRNDNRFTSPKTRRKTVMAGAPSGRGDGSADSPQSETRKLRTERRKQKRRESETLRTNRSLDDDLGFEHLRIIGQATEKSNGVRFRDDVKDKVATQNAGERRKSPRTEGRKKVEPSPRTKSKKMQSPKTPSKRQKDDNLKVNFAPPIWDDEYGDQDVPLKKTEAPSWAIENADVYEPTKSDNRKKEAPSWALENADVYEPIKGDNNSKPSTSKLGAMESMEDASESQHDFDYQEEARNRRPDFDSGENWLEPIGDDEVPPPPPPAEEEIGKGNGKRWSKILPVEKADKGDPKDRVAASQKSGAENKLAEKNDDNLSVEKVVDENSSESSGEYSSESAESGPIPGEIPVADKDYSKRVSALPINHGVSSSEDEEEEEEEGEDSDGSSESLISSDESSEGGEIPAVVSVQGSLEEGLGDQDVSSVGSASLTSMHSEEEEEEEDDDEEVEDIPPPPPYPPPEDIPPPPSDPPPPPPEHSDKARTRKTKLSAEKENKDDAAFDNVFSNEISALEGTLQGMSDMLVTPAVNTKKNAGAPSSSVDQNNHNHQLDYKFLMNILSVIAPLSAEQKTLMASDNPAVRGKVMLSIVEKEQRSRQQMIQKVQKLESKLSVLQKDLEIQTLEASTHKMQVAAQDLAILDYKESLENLTQKCQSLEKETDATALKYREQEEKTHQMTESLEETKKLIQEQQFFMNAQQRQMQTLETKISSFQESRQRDESKMHQQNEKLRELVRIQQEEILKALGSYDA